MNKKNLSFIIIISIITGFLYNYFSGNGLPLIRKEMQIEYVSDSTFSSLHNGNGNDELTIKGLNLDQTYKLYTSRMAVFIDARDQWEYAEVHVTGSVNIPEFSFEPEDPKVTGLGRDQIYVVYCDGDDCDVSKRLAAELVKIGFSKVYVFLGGIDEWVEAGYPTEGNKTE